MQSILSQQRKSLLQIRWRKRLYHTGTVLEPRPEDSVRILEHAVFQTDHNELRSFEPRLNESSNILCMREIERRIDFVKDVHWCGFELEERHY